MHQMAEAAVLWAGAAPCMCVGYVSHASDGRGSSAVGRSSPMHVCGICITCIRRQRQRCCGPEQPHACVWDMYHMHQMAEAAVLWAGAAPCMCVGYVSHASDGRGS